MVHANRSKICRPVAPAPDQTKVDQIVKRGFGLAHRRIPWAYGSCPHAGVAHPIFGMTAHFAGRPTRGQRQIRAPDPGTHRRRLIRIFGRSEVATSMHDATITARDEILAALPAICARAADGTFTPQDVVDELRRRGSTYAVSTIRTLVVSRMCATRPTTMSGPTTISNGWPTGATGPARQATEGLPVWRPRRVTRPESARSPSAATGGSARTPSPRSRRIRKPSAPTTPAGSSEVSGTARLYSPSTVRRRRLSTKSAWSWVSSGGTTNPTCE
jgi:hypothetical protein